MCPTCFTDFIFIKIFIIWYNIKSHQSFFCKVPAVAYASTNAVVVSFVLHTNDTTTARVRHNASVGGFGEHIYIYGTVVHNVKHVYTGTTCTV